MSAREVTGINVAQLIADLRGGWTEKCDFCDKTSGRYVPEEAGQWACIECWDRWEREDADSRTGEIGGAD